MPLLTHVVPRCAPRRYSVCAFSKDIANVRNLDGNRPFKMLFSSLAFRKLNQLDTEQYLHEKPFLFFMLELSQPIFKEVGKGIGIYFWTIPNIELVQ